MKTITVKTLQGLKEALQSEEKNLQISTKGYNLFRR